MARLFLLVLCAAVASAAEICYSGDAKPTAGVCSGKAVPQRMCVADEDVGKAALVVIETSLGENTDTANCESTMNHVCPMITEGATGVTGDAACALGCSGYGAAVCTTGKFMRPIVTRVMPALSSPANSELTARSLFGWMGRCRLPQRKAPCHLLLGIPHTPHLPVLTLLDGYTRDA